jgi:hypothetical protein
LVEVIGHVRNRGSFVVKAEAKNGDALVEEEERVAQLEAVARYQRAAVAVADGK